jgi:2-polyprenyl-3-methyl-5-hydroxy-6-metoxy-1,4-benzoquinol methylase
MSIHLQTWENYQKFADDRGRLVATILQQFTSLEGKKILDFGCGEGGTSKFLAQLGSEVTAVDIQSYLEQNFKNSDVIFLNMNENESYLQFQRYDIIVLQDVLEHVPNPDTLLKRMKYALRNGGLIYISTPNRFSVLNAISDPHWNLPGVALLPRRMVSFWVQKIFRRDLRQRADWAALLSLNKLKKSILRNDFEIIFVNSLVAKLLFQNPHSVVCNPSHIRLVQWMKSRNVDRWVYQVVNDRTGLFNFLINPTWYVIGRTR